MKFRFAYNNIHVFNLERSLKFYGQALGLTEVARKEAPDGSYILAYLGDGSAGHPLMLTWLRDRQDPCNVGGNGDNNTHLAFYVEDMQGAYQLHKTINCICYENSRQGVYFISDPDGYWLEIVPVPAQE